VSKLKTFDNSVVASPWQGLRQFTSARIALGRAGLSMPTEPQLAFQLAHAQARDAVHQALDVMALKQNLMLQLSLPEGQVICLQSAAPNRSTYLKRPDLGRKLSEASRALLQKIDANKTLEEASAAYDLAFVLVDGLSALAIENNACNFLKMACSRFVQEGLKLAPFTVVEQGRVAIGDQVGELLKAKLVVVMIGERPGLSSPDSMGLYITWNPTIGLTDERRNCISNIHQAGMSYAQAANKLGYLLKEASERQLTGVALKDDANGLQAALTGLSLIHI
jgi:ethanolamine ammonia-lyase small subunit